MLSIFYLSSKISTLSFLFFSFLLSSESTSSFLLSFFFFSFLIQVVISDNFDYYSKSLDFDYTHSLSLLNGNIFIIHKNGVMVYNYNLTIILYDYNEVTQELEKSDKNLTTFYEQESTNHRMYLLIKNIKKGAIFDVNFDIIETLKSIKNPVEIEGFKKANLKDSVALVKFFAWMEDELVTKNRTDLNEYQIGLKSKEFREQQENFMGESFAPICGCGGNAAIIHYEQNENLHSDMNKNLIILCDTGAQYKEGTTDITRTVHYGTPTKKEKEMYTRVLLGNLSLERLLFKNGKKLANLDCIPRSYLNMVGEDYMHGTSHGVGHFLNVHEGPYGQPLTPGDK